MVKKVIALTKIFVKDFYQNIKIINLEERKIDKKSVLFWILTILSITITYISYKAIQLLITAGAPELFLTFFIAILSLLTLYQIAFVSTNIFFFSKDLEFVLPLPIKSKELILAKFNTVLIMAYTLEIGFGIIPLILYGFMNFTTFGYFIWMIITLILLPIAFVAVFGFITIILMKILGFIRNKIVLQNIISVILVILLFAIEFQLFGSEENLKGDHFFVEYITNALRDVTFLEKLQHIASIAIIDIISITLFVFLAKNIYLKAILKSISSAKILLNKKNIKKKIVHIKAKKVGFEYVKKEFKMLYKKPVFLMQTVMPVIIVLITIVILANVLIPMFYKTVQNDESLKEEFALIKFDTEIVMVILGGLQVLFSLSGVSLTAISREGKNAVFMKYIPVSLYKQFLYKNVVQVVLNLIVSTVVLTIIYYYFPEINFVNIMLLFIASIFINLINSYLMLILDLRRPYLNWNSEHSVLKRNNNKSIQYALMIVMILIFLYFANIFKEINVTLSLAIEAGIFAISFVILNQLVKKNTNKLFNKII